MSDLLAMMGIVPTEEPSLNKSKRRKKKNRDSFEDDPMYFAKVDVPGYGLGHVVGYEYGHYAVDFDDYIEYPSSCGGLCRKWHGAWIPEEKIEFGIAIIFNAD